MDLDELLSLTERGLGDFPSRSTDHIRHVVAPYRICPLGAHIDHQGGPVLGRTIDAYTVLAYTAIDRPLIKLASGNYPGSAVISLADPGPINPDRWDRYARGAVQALGKHHFLDRGLLGFVQGTLPGGGLSSSASVGLTYLAALATVNEISPDRQELIELDRQLENDHLGLQNGILDQTTILYGRANSMLFIDTQKRAVEAVADPPQASKHRFVAFYSGISRELTATPFNERVIECRQAAVQLAQYAGLDQVKRLGDVPEAIWRKHGHRLPDPLRRRAQHFYDEVARVHGGRDAWRNGELARFGRLMTESCASSIDLYESGSPELIRLQEMVSQTAGVLGSRFSGGGYGGCVVALVAEESSDQVRQEVGGRFASAYPGLRDRFASFVTASEDGLQRR